MIHHAGPVAGAPPPRGGHAAPALRWELLCLVVTGASLAAAAMLLASRGAAALAALLCGVALGASVAATAVHRGTRRSVAAIRAMVEAVAATGDAVAPLTSPDPDVAGVGAALNRVAAAAADDRRRLREVAARAFRAQESERLRIASELQEQTAQTLAGLLIQLRVARGARDAAVREQVLEQLRAGLAEATDSVRRYARGLYPPALDDIGVVAAVEAYALALSEAASPVITVAAEDIVGVLARDGEIALYRTVQEALANAVRHAGARSIRVEVLRWGGGVRAIVEDDGRGFDPRQRDAIRPSLGLLGMRERALYAGGAAELTSRPGEGTRVVIDIPGIPRTAAPPAGLAPIVAAAASSVPVQER